MAEPDHRIEFSLDCELLWGMKPGVGDRYINFHVGRSQDSLNAIVSRWKSQHSNLYLAFVGKSLPIVSIDDEDLRFLTVKGYQKFLGDPYLQFSNFNFECVGDNIKLGLHGFAHKLYTDLSPGERLEESEAIEVILKENAKFGEFFVYPKNLADSETVGWYRSRFSRIRVNSRSWLYRTSMDGVGPVRRILRFVDSFLPIYELFCDKRPEHEIDNAVTGTHFYRANLSPFFLVLHYVRLRIGILIMNLMSRKVHIWSHPHNFGGRELAIDLFVRLSR